MNYLWRAVILACVTFILSFGLTFLFCKLFRQGPDSKPASYGGLAIYASFWLGFFMMFPSLLFNSTPWYLFLSSTIILITGLLDDYYVLKPWQKSLGILIASHMVFFLTEVEFSSAFLPAMPDWAFKFLSYFLTIIWLYFVTNAVNLMDGIDGLASSVSLASLLILAITTLLFSSSIRLAFLFLLVFLIAAILGFLPFNWSPAKIYLGDTGALFIGFMFASLSVTNLKHASFYTMLLPVFVYVVPLFDTSYAIFRRLIRGQSIVERDQDHIHHRLIRQGYSSPKIVFIMLGITLIFSVLAIAAQQFRAYRLWILGFTFIVVLLLSYFMYNIGHHK